MTLAGEDYSPVAVTLTFNPGVLELPVPVMIVDDLVRENYELFNATLRTNSSVFRPGVYSMVSLTIVDDDGLLLESYALILAGFIIWNWSPITVQKEHNNYYYYKWNIKE